MKTLSTSVLISFFCFPSPCLAVHDRMTELQRKMPTLTEEQYLGLVNEALHWLEHSEVRGDPLLQALAFQMRDTLEEVSLPEDAHLADEVRENLWWLRRGVAGGESKQ